MDDFVVRAVLAGIGVAIVAAPLGCFVVWRRMAYFGDTLAHSALLGIVMGLVLEVDFDFGIVVVCAGLATALVVLQRGRQLASDTLLGILSHGALALGVIAVATMPTMRVDLISYLFGDILAVSQRDLAFIYGGGALVLAVVAWLWRPLLAIAVHEELARVEGVRVGAVRLALMLLMAVVIALAMKIVGVLLITALLIIPAAAARRLARTPEWMAVAAALVGAAAAVVGLGGSFAVNAPSGPSIVVAALALFVLSLLVPATRRR